MKKLMAMVLTIAMVMSMVFVMPASAESTGTGTISISTVRNGETYAVGGNIPLAITSSDLASTIDYVDFYANDVKIPGSITGGTGSLVWSNVKAGTYSLYAKAIMADTTYVESTPITIKVEATYNNLFEAKADLSNVTVVQNASNYVVTTRDDMIIRGAKALRLQIPADKNTYKYGKVDIACNDSSYRGSNSSKFRMLVYNAGDAVELIIAPQVSTGTNAPAYSHYGFRIEPGWNLVRFNSSDSRIYHSLRVHWSGYKVADGNMGFLYKEIDLSFSPLWVETDADALVGTPEIANGAQNVNPAITEYKVNFSQSLTAPAVAKIYEAETVTSETPAIEGVTVATNGDVLTLSGLSLNPSTTYTVKIENPDEVTGITPTSPNGSNTISKDLFSVAGSNGADFADATYTFTTAASSEAAAKSIKVVYPLAGSTVGNTTKLVATTDSLPEGATIEFYDGETKLDGTVNARTGEYQLDYTFATAGSHSITAKIISGETVIATSGAVAFTSAAAGTRTVAGFGNNLRYILNAGFTPVAEVTSTADDIAKVEFMVEGDPTSLDSVAIAPYKWTAPSNLTHVGSHNLIINIFDKYGSVETKTIPYVALLGKTVYSDEDNFEETRARKVALAGTNYAVAASADYFDITADNVKNLVYIDNTTSTAMDNYNLVLNGGSTGGTTNLVNAPVYLDTFTIPSFDIDTMNFLYYEFDMKAASSSTRAAVSLTSTPDVKNKFFGERRLTGGGANLSTERHHIGVLIDTKNKVATIYADGNATTHLLTGTNAFVDGSAVVLGLVTGYAKTYVDNLKMAAYTAADAMQGYTINGIADGEIIIAGEETAGRTVAVVDAANVNDSNQFQSTKANKLIEPTEFASATFTLDGVVRDTVEGKPYAVVLPTDEIGSHTLVVSATDKFGVVHQIGTYNYVVTNGKHIGGQTLIDFESDVKIDDKATTNAHIYSGKGKLELVNVALSGETDNYMLKLCKDDSSTGVANTSYLAFVPNEGKSISLTGGTAKMIYVDFDVYHVGGGQTQFQIGQNTDKTGVGTFGSANYSHSFKAISNVTAGSANDPAATGVYTGLDENALAHIRVKYDIANNTRTVYLDGYEWLRGQINADTTVLPVSTYYFRIYNYFHTNQDDSARYIDNIKVSVYDYELEVAWDDPTITTIAGSNTMRVYNPTANPYTFLNICAGYDANGVLVDAVAETVTVAAGGSEKKTYDMTALTAATTYKMFTWDAVSNYPYIIPSAE